MSDKDEINMEISNKEIYESLAEIKTEIKREMAEQEAQEENNQEEVSENPEKLIENLLTPDMKFKLKVPIKAKKHNAHEVLNDYEYVWNINTKET